MPYILSDRKSTYGSPYAFYSCLTSQKSRTPTTATLVVTAYGYLQYSSSYLGTGSGMGLVAGIQIAGTWHTWTLKSESTKWSGTAKHSAETTITVPAAINATSLPANFRVLRSKTSNSAASLIATKCSNAVVTSVSDTYVNVEISGEATSQAEAEATVTGLPASVGYERVICWYKGGVLAGTTTIPANSTVTSYTQKFTGLLPSATYDITAEVRYANASGTLLSTKAVSFTTPGETGALDLTAKATHILVEFTGMFNTPNYERLIEIYYKKSDSNVFMEAESVRSQGTSAAVTITGLTSNEKYDVKVYIKSGATTLLALDKTVTTLVDTSLLPTGIIKSITQKLGTRECTVTWQADKAVAGTSYELQAQVAGSSEWETLITSYRVYSPYVVTAPAGNVDVHFRIASRNDDVVDGKINYSDICTFYVRDDFVWDHEKKAGGTFIITANEWNRLREYVVSRNADIGKTLSIPLVRSGEAITAETYNRMKNAINNITATGIADKKRGDAITAADIDRLRVAINTVSS